MKRVKNTIALLIALVVLVFLLYKSYPYMEVSYYNRYINASGVKLNMMEEEVFEELGQEGEFVPGMGGHGWRYEYEKIFITISNHGIFRDKVCQIDTENESHDILGIKVGSSFDNAVRILHSKGFNETSRNFFTKGNVYVQLVYYVELSGVTVVSRLRIGIEDPAYKDVVF